MVDQYALTLPYLVDNDDVMSTKLPDKDLFVKIFIFFYYNCFYYMDYCNHFH